MKPKIFLTGSTSYLGSKFIELYSLQFNILGVARTDTNNPVNLLDFQALKPLFFRVSARFYRSFGGGFGERQQNCQKSY